MAQLEGVLKENIGVFSQDDQDYGYTETIRHQIDTGGAPPVRQRHRPLPPSQYQIVREHIQGLLEKGIIQESQSPWASPVVVVMKKDSSIRLCVDYRQLNCLTRRDSFPLPRIEESLQAFGGAKYFSVLDLTSGYYQVAMDPEDIAKTAFVVPFGLFEYTRLPFGLTNAPATFQRVMQRCLGDKCYSGVLIYLDDIIVYSPDFETHLRHLSDVFSRLKAFGLKLKPVKCHLLKTEVQYLGHCVSATGVAVDQTKISAVREWPVPKTVRNIRAFLGFTGFFRRFVSGYATIAAPLFRYLRSPSDDKRRKGTKKAVSGLKKVELDEAGRKAFQTLIQCLTDAPVLKYANFQRPFKVETDASGAGLGAILYQEDDEGKEHVIAYASRILKSAERRERYGAFKLELLAVKWAIVEVFKDYVMGNECVVVTDHHPLLFLDKAKLGCTEMRWVQQLSSFDKDGLSTWKEKPSCRCPFSPKNCPVR